VSLFCDTSFKARRIEISLLTYLLTAILTMADHFKYSALGVSHVMRSINVRYLLTYLLTYLMADQ